MDGCEEALEAHIKKTHSQFKPSLEDEGLPFCFCEVGFADGVTHKAVRDILVETGDTNFITLGVDIKRGYEAAISAIHRTFPPKEDSLIVTEVPDNYIKEVGILDSIPNLFLKDASAFLSQNFPTSQKIHVGIVDACHCKEHTMKDFLAMEPLVAEGGIVIFHDVGVEEQGSDSQHDGHYIEVREALFELNLFKGGRKGWGLPEIIPGNNSKGLGEGNSCAVFTKVKI